MWGLHRLWVLTTLELAFGIGSTKVLVSELLIRGMTLQQNESD